MLYNLSYWAPELHGSVATWPSETELHGSLELSSITHELQGSSTTSPSETELQGSLETELQGSLETKLHGSLKLSYMAPWLLGLLKLS